LVSGFCSTLGSRRLRRGVTVLLASFLVSAATLIFMPRAAVLFGVLTMLGSCMIIMVPLEKLLRRVNPFVGFALFLLLFILTEYMPFGWIGVGNMKLNLPRALFANYLTAYIGFPPASFSSTDYYPIFPWIFLFICGYFLYRIFEELDILRFLRAPRIKPLEFIGRHTLIIYMAHQPIIYAALYVIFKMI
jgi:uncharacterized membrane protein